MMSKPIELRLSQLLGFGCFLTAVLVVSGSVTDPVNVTKLLSLGVLGGAVFGVLLHLQINASLRVNTGIFWLAGLFLVFSTTSVLQSNSPLVQNLYGVYGRNNGLITYLFLVLIMVGASILRERLSFLRIIYGLIFAGIVNMVYCLWVIAFGDFMSWNNPYGNILGTFGNPNFIGSFLGIFFSVVFAFCVSHSSPRWLKISAVPFLVLIGYVIVDSSAIQGRVVAALGTGLVLFFYIRSRFSPAIQIIYSIAACIVGTLGIAGALQKGPLAEYIYKTSVSLRGQYWLAGWNTGEANPFFGSGMDAFGDWYRRTRDIKAIELPGANTVVNAAHNVPLDMFAFGGWPLFLSYLGIMLLGAIAVIKLMLRSRQYDVLTVTLAVAWIGYQVQSLISINQIGLAIWGWCLTGALVGYEISTRGKQGNDQDTRNTGKRRLSRVDSESASSLVLIFTFSVVGMVVALPPLAADAKWRNAQTATTLEAVEASMVPGLFNPQNSTKYQMNIQLLERSNFPELAHKYALVATAWNRESFDLWKMLYLVKNSSPEEKALALENMKRLDPLNPDVTSIK